MSKVYIEVTPELLIEIAENFKDWAKVSSPEQLADPENRMFAGIKNEEKTTTVFLQWHPGRHEPV